MAAETKTMREVYLLKIADIFERKDKAPRKSSLTPRKSQAQATREEHEAKAKLLLEDPDKQCEPGREYEVWLNLCSKNNYPPVIDKEVNLSKGALDDIKRKMRSMDIFRPAGDNMSKNIMPKTKILVYSNSKRSWCEGVVKKLLENDMVKVQYKTAKGKDGKFKYSDKKLHRAALGTTWKLKKDVSDDDIFQLISDEELKDAFDEADVSGDGLISAKEFRQMLQTLNCDLASVGLNDKVVFNTIDADNSGEIDFDEWKAAANTIVIQAFCSEYCSKTGIGEWSVKDVKRWVRALQTKHLTGTDYHERFGQMKVDGEGLLNCQRDLHLIKTLIDGNHTDGSQVKTSEAANERIDFKKMIELCKVWYKYLIGLNEISDMPTVDQETLARINSGMTPQEKRLNMAQLRSVVSPLAAQEAIQESGESARLAEEQRQTIVSLKRQLERAQTDVAELQRDRDAGEGNECVREKALLLNIIQDHKQQGQFGELSEVSDLDELIRAVQAICATLRDTIGTKIREARKENMKSKEGKDQLIALIRKLCEDNQRDGIMASLGDAPDLNKITITMSDMFKDGRGQVIKASSKLNIAQQQINTLKKQIIELEQQTGGQTPEAGEVKRLTKKNEELASEKKRLEAQKKQLDQDYQDLKDNPPSGCCVIS